MTSIELLRYGLVPYGQGLALQQELRTALLDDPGRDGFLVCLQHPPVVTLGKRGEISDLLSPTALRERGAEVFRVDRGGEATYHGPGQLVIYPVVRLEAVGLGVVDLVRGLASALAETVADYGVECTYQPEHPGLWTTEEPSRKIASVGMRVSRGVSTHGAAINLVNDLIPFSYIVACGMPNAPMTRLADYLDGELDLEEFVDRVLPRLGRLLDGTLRVVERPLPDHDSWVEPLDWGALGREERPAEGR